MSQQERQTLTNLVQAVGKRTYRQRELPIGEVPPSEPEAAESQPPAESEEPPTVAS